VSRRSVAEAETSARLPRKSSAARKRMLSGSRTSTCEQPCASSIGSMRASHRAPSRAPGGSLSSAVGAAPGVAAAAVAAAAVVAAAVAAAFAFAAAAAILGPSWVDKLAAGDAPDCGDSVAAACAARVLVACRTTPPIFETAALSPTYRDNRSRWTNLITRPCLSRPLAEPASPLPSASTPLGLSRERERRTTARRLRRAGSQHARAHWR